MKRLEEAHPDGLKLRKNTARNISNADTLEEAEYKYSGVLGTRPSLKIANAWNTNVILPRRVLDPTTGEYRLAEMGEENGENYSVWKTRIQDLSDFGIGIGLYFHSLMDLCMLMFVLALVSIPTINYYLSAEYSGPMRDRHLDPRIWGSAVCTTEEPVNVTLNNGSVAVMEHQNCPLNELQLHVDIVTIIVLWLYIFVAGVIQDRKIVNLDESEQTAQDYSIEVTDPDEDATDPEEWKSFFSQFGQVKLVTVALDNHEFIEALAHQRYIKYMIHLETKDENAQLLPVNQSRVSACTRILQKIGFCCDLAYWQRQLIIQREKIHALSEKCYPVKSVFVTFDTEQAQRKCLNELKTGLFASRLDTVSNSAIPAEKRFREKNVLRVVEPSEPSDILWLNIGVGWKKRVTQQILAIAIVCGFMAGTLYVTSLVRDDPALFGSWEPYVSAYLISFIDFFVSNFMRKVNDIEQHRTYERQQLSLLNKLVFFRCFNTAFVIYWITNFELTLDQRTLIRIQAILIANMVTTPALQLISAGYRFRQIFFAPRAATQTKMNSYFNGVYWNLAERYTDVTKTVWVALFYKPLLPSGMFIVTVGLFINYWVDKYCLLRKYKVPPKYGPVLGRASRWHLFLVGGFTLVMTMRWYAGWSYDETCSFDGGETFSQCDKYPTSLFFPSVKGWMSGVQKDMVSQLKYIVIVLLACGAAFIMFGGLYRVIKALCFGNYDSVGEAKQTRYSEVNEITAYVPQFQPYFLNFPLIAVDISKFNTDHISWQGNHLKYCLAREGEVVSPQNKVLNTRHLFSSVTEFKVDMEEIDGKNGLDVNKYNNVQHI